jgi:Holliday junction resolvase-like predicted endonuclease
MGKEDDHMLAAAQIGTIGEVHATEWLKAKGYSCYRNTQLPGATDIQANGNPTSLLVQVKTAVWPSSAANLSSEERKAIVTRANHNGRQAWLAQLQINNKGEMVGEIAWTKLN